MSAPKPLLSPPRQQAFYLDSVRPVLNVLVGLLLLLIFVISAPFVGGLVWLTLGRPVFFRQKRIGQGEAPFTLIKYRTLPLPGQESPSIWAQDFLRALRRSRLDELPGVYRLLAGGMSLVGPRPLLPEYLPHYPPRAAQRHRLQPGFTGLAVVLGGNWLPWSRRLAADAYYARHASARLDCWILWRTLLLLAGLGEKRAGPYPDQSSRLDHDPGFRHYRRAES